MADDMSVDKALELLSWAVASSQAFNREGRYDRDVEPRCIQADRALRVVRAALEKQKELERELQLLKERVAVVRSLAETIKKAGHPHGPDGDPKMLGQLVLLQLDSDQQEGLES